MNSINTEKTPCLVETQQGVSVKYQEKFLYSKYNPSKSIETIINNINILPGTVFLCCSPVMEYGLESLLKKLPDHCLLILCEKDCNLQELLNKYYLKLFYDNTNIILPSAEELLNLPVILNKKNYRFSEGKTIFSGFYKRIVRIDFSAGIQFNAAFYNELELACIKAIKTFWVNRVTLTKFGRKYSLNLFRNLSILPETTPIKNYFNSITKPIIICGAGESLNKGINDFKHNADDYYIIAVDTAANYLIKNNIIPDAIFIEETQNVILKAFFNVKNIKSQIFAGLSSLANLNHIITDYSRFSFFFTEYSNSDFLNELKQKPFFPVSNPPFGSVGLTAVYYSLHFRHDDSIPVFIYGLDFSYSTGITHVKNSISGKERLIHSNKLTSIANYNSAFSNTIKVKNNLYTTVSLQNYAELFVNYFNNSKNLYDSRNYGLNLYLPYSIPFTLKNNSNLNTKTIGSNKTDIISMEEIKIYFLQEKSALNKIRNILKNKDNETKKLSDAEVQTLLFNLLENREYLYLHFIDGYQLSLNINFLKRIRTEIDFFIKEFEIILRAIN